MLVPVFDYSVSQAGGFLPDAMWFGSQRKCRRYNR